MSISQSISIILLNEGVCIEMCRRIIIIEKKYCLPEDYLSQEGILITRAN